MRGTSESSLSCREKVRAEASTETETSAPAKTSTSTPYGSMKTRRLMLSLGMI